MEIEAQKIIEKYSEHLAETTHKLIMTEAMLGQVMRERDELKAQLGAAQ